MLKCVMNLVDIDYPQYTSGVYKENPKGVKKGLVRERTLVVRTWPKCVPLFRCEYGLCEDFLFKKSSGFVLEWKYSLKMFNELSLKGGHSVSLFLFDDRKQEMIATLEKNVDFLPSFSTWSSGIRLITASLGIYFEWKMCIENFHRVPHLSLHHAHLILQNFGYMVSRLLLLSCIHEGPMIFFFVCGQNIFKVALESVCVYQWKQPGQCGDTLANFAKSRLFF